MTDDETRIMALVEEVLNSSRTPDEACRECPDLLPSVRARLNRFREMEACVAEVFPPRDESPDLSRGFLRRSAHSLPCIQGYDVLELVGTGGMGAVYKARHLKLRRVVAIKVLLAGGYAGSRELERFKREAEAVASLQHPNVVQVFDAGENEGFPYFTMEFMEGGSLSQKLAGAPTAAGHAATSVVMLARAVEAAHAKGIVHRDLKPGNVLIGADELLKIADFGLARRLDGANASAVTFAGARVGTPSYMSPEQATGRAGEVGPASDIYSLGAILYEMLTGRPPFRGETALETERQAIYDEPVPPSRLNPRVPRDLETICLKCLQKEPSRRYASATALADDLTRFSDGRPIEARPVGWVERGWRWGRRNPAAVALVVTALALAGLTGAGAVSLVRQHAEGRAEAIREAAESRDVVRSAVAQAERLWKGFQFREARAALERANGPLDRGWRRLAPAVREELRHQMAQAGHDLDLVERLDGARARHATLLARNDNPSGVEPLYLSAFAEAQLGQIGDNAAQVAQRIRVRTVCSEIVAGLDDWASITADEQRRAWLLDVARAADPNALRDRIRQPSLWRDRAQLKELFEEHVAAEISPQLATALSRMARSDGGDAAEMLTTVVSQHPQDFWLNFELAWALYNAKRYDEALGYYRVAMALRPDVTVARDGVGMVLHRLRRNDEAIKELQRAIKLDPDSGLAYSWLGFALYEKGEFDEAIEQMRQAVLRYPESSGVHLNLGSALNDRGRVDESMPYLQRAVELDPKQAGARSLLATILRNKGRSDEALQLFRQAVEIEPDEPVWHMNLGSALGADKKTLNEGIQELRRAIELDPNLSTAHHNLAAVLGTDGRIDEGIEHAQEAVRLEPKSVMTHFTLSGLLHDKGRLEDAVNEAQRAVQLDPNHSEAQAQLNRCLSNAARAALAGTLEPGDRASPPSASELSGMRSKALGWLRADLELTAKLRNDGKPVSWSLIRWQTDAALASVREKEALAKLPDGEREKWERLWADVASLLAADAVAQGREFTARRNWAAAADAYARATEERKVNDGHFWFEYAALTLLSNNHSAYTATCARMIEAAGKPGGPRAYHTARASTLAPDGAADIAVPARLAERELQGSADQFWSLTEQGALAYRAGRIEESVSLFERSLRADEHPGRAVVNWLWLALADQKLGKTDDARRWLQKAQAWLDQFTGGMPANAEAELGLHLHNWLEAQVLLREAAGVPERQ